MTLEQKLERVNRWRIRPGDTACHRQLTSEDSDGWNGTFKVPIDGQMWQVICSDGWAWKHVSVTNAQRKELPNWNVMCRIKDLFFDDEAWAVQFHPPRADYVNDHPYVLHLWQPLKETLPTPTIIMV